MGGNCIKNAHTRRYDADEYYSLCDDVIRKISFGDNTWLSVEVIPSYRNKESFGDMDILYSTFTEKPFTKNKIHEMFPESKEIVVNTNVTSFEYEEFQIDLIHVRNDIIDYALNYFSFSDLGNLIGRIAHRFGLKHGHNGLFLPLRDGDNKFAEILLTDDYSTALKFLDLDPNRFKQGFDDLEDMFEYVTSSKWFHPDSYDLAELSHMHRTRDRKRVTYQKFLEYIKDWSGEVIPRRPNKQDYMEEIFDFFPGAREQFRQVMADLAMKKMAKEKFNGDVVSEITGLVDRELGEFMKTLRNLFWFRPENLIYSTDSQIRERIEAHFKKWTENGK